MMNSQKTNPLALRSFEGLPNNGDPFLDCRLDRKKYAEILTNIVLTYHRGFVLALSSDWGTGKTFFVKRWEKYLECPPVDTKHPPINTIYFNAWENDFDNNALIALLAELQSVVLDQNRELYKKLIEKTSLIVKRILPTTAKFLGKIFLGGEDISEIIKELTAASLTTTSDSINDYIQKKKDIQDFKDALSAFVQSTNQDKPLVIFIDELDRCRPDYAVEVLEAVKHLFNIDGIVFVLSIDKKHLASSIKGYYGSDNINTDEYLRRFIDLEYTLPEPSVEKFCGYLYDKYSLQSLPNNMVNKNDVVCVIEIYSKVFHVTLRQLEKIIVQYYLTMKVINTANSYMHSVVLLLVFIKNNNYDFYKNIITEQLKFNQLEERLRILFDSKERIHSNPNYLLQGTAFLLYLYYKMLSDNFSNRTRESVVEFFKFNVNNWSNEYEDVILNYMNDILQYRRDIYTFQKIVDTIESLDSLS